MENNSSQNQNKNSSSNNNSSGNEGQKKQGGGESVLTLLQPHDMSRTVESALHVFQGRHDKLPDLMQDVGHIPLKATERFSTTQLILAAGAVTLGAVLLTRYAGTDEFEVAE